MSAAKMPRSDLVIQRAKRRSCMYQKILLAFDGSPDGREALAQAESWHQRAMRRFILLRSLTRPKASSLLRRCLSSPTINDL